MKYALYDFLYIFYIVSIFRLKETYLFRPIEGEGEFISYLASAQVYILLLLSSEIDIEFISQVL